MVCFTKTDNVPRTLKPVIAINIPQVREAFENRGQGIHAAAQRFCSKQVSLNNDSVVGCVTFLVGSGDPENTDLGAVTGAVTDTARSDEGVVVDVNILVPEPNAQHLNVPLRDFQVRPLMDVYVIVVHLNVIVRGSGTHLKNHPARAAIVGTAGNHVIMDFAAPGQMSPDNLIRIGGRTAGVVPRSIEIVSGVRLQRTGVDKDQGVITAGATGDDHAL